MTVLDETNRVTTRRLTRTFIEAQRKKGWYPYVHANPNYKRGNGLSRILTTWYPLPDTKIVSDVRMYKPNDLVLYTGVLVRGHNDRTIYRPYHIYRINRIYNTQDVKGIHLHCAGNQSTQGYLSGRIALEHVQHISSQIFYYIVRQ